VGSIPGDPLGWQWYVSGMMLISTTSLLAPEIVVGNQFDVEAPGLSKTGRLQVSWTADGTPAAGCRGWTATDVTGTLWADLDTYTGDLVFPEIGESHPVMDAFDLQDLITNGTIDIDDPMSRHFPTDLILTPTGLTVELSFDPPQAPGDLFFINWGDGTINECNYDGKDHEYDAAGTYTVAVRENQSSNWTISKQVTVA
jgi:hypothetical protein